MKKIDLLQDLLKHVDSLTVFANEFWATATTEQLNFRISESDWTVAEVMTHLITFNGHYFDKLEKAIINATPQGEEGTYQPSPIGGMLLNQIHPNNLSAMYESGHFNRSELLSVPPNVVNLFLDCQARLEACLLESAAVDIVNTPVLSKFDQFFYFQLGDCLQLLVKHESLHFAQAQHIMGKYKQA